MSYDELVISFQITIILHEQFMITWMRYVFRFHQIQKVEKYIIKQLKNQEKVKTQLCIITTNTIGAISQSHTSLRI